MWKTFWCFLILQQQNIKVVSLINERISFYNLGLIKRLEIFKNIVYSMTEMNPGLKSHKFKCYNNPTFEIDFRLKLI